MTKPQDTGEPSVASPGYHDLRAGDVVDAYPLFQAGGGGSTPTSALWFEKIGLRLANELLSRSHYLGPSVNSKVCYGGFVGTRLVCCQVWRSPAARMLPQDGSWLELCRWCLTPAAGKNAGSKMMRWVRSQIAQEMPQVGVLVSYSDPVHGHNGALYRASGWSNRPTHHEERWRKTGVGYPSGHGNWGTEKRQSPKQRWCIEIPRTDKR